MNIWVIVCIVFVKYIKIYILSLVGSFIDIFDSVNDWFFFLLIVFFMIIIDYFMILLVFMYVCMYKFFLVVLYFV